MELLPILRPEDKPLEKQWYALMPRGEAPGLSVGHTCTFVPTAAGGKGRIVIVGGANPSGSFSHSSIINLDSHEWDIPEWEGLEARYEHCSFVPESDPEGLWVFGGAEQSANRNCIQHLRTNRNYESVLWRTVDVKGTRPSPRTYHTTSACVKDRLFVFSGGESGATPVTDPQLHVFNTVTCTWTQPDTKGPPPSPRHGHVIVAVGSVLYVHGGISGQKFHSDMFSLDTESMTWKRVKAKGDVPGGTAAHAAVALGRDFYIFGGMTADGASNSMYKFQTDKQRWTLMAFKGDLPPNRLDHSMCVMPWTNGSVEERAEPKYLCFVFGGMDTGGLIFNDCLVTMLT